MANDYISQITLPDNTLYDIRDDAALPKDGGTMTGPLKFSGNTSRALTWEDGTWWQRILTTNDSTAGTAVFTFQQTSDSGSTWTDLFTIKDNGTVVATTFSGNASTATKLASNASNTSASFWRGDNTWSSTLTGSLTLYKEGTSANDSPIQLIFTNKDTTTNQSANATISVYNDHASSSCGNNMVINPAGVLILGGGEGPGGLYNAIKSSIGTSEHVYIVSDNSSYIYSNSQTVANRVGILIDTSGNVVPQKAEAANSNKQNLGASSNKWANVYATNLYGTVATSQLSGTVSNSQLANPSITVGNKSISLGGSGSVRDILYTGTILGKTSSWNLTTAGIYGVAADAQFTGDGNPEATSAYRYGHMIITRASDTYGIGQFYVAHTASSTGHGIKYRSGWNGSYVAWATILDSANYTEYTVKKDGTGATGSWNITAAKATADASGNNIEDTYATQTTVNGLLAAADAMIFKGTIGTGGTITALPASHNAGDTYRVITADTYAGKYCEVGTLIICVADGAAAADADWTSVETNEDGSVISSSTDPTDNALVRYDGTTGRIIQKSTATINDTGTMTIKGKLIVNPSYDTSNSYNEGIRINLGSNNWANINFGGTKDTTAGTADGIWLVGRRGTAGGKAGAVGDFTIEEGGSDGGGLTIHKDYKGMTLYTSLAGGTTAITLNNAGTVAAGTNHAIIRAYSANLAATAYTLISIGKAASNNNSGWLGFYYAGNASNDNYLMLGIYGQGVDGSLKIYGSGQVKVIKDTDSSSTSTGSFVVSGGAGIAKSLYVGSGITITSTTAANHINFSRTGGHGSPNYINVPASSSLAVSVGGASGSNIIAMIDPEGIVPYTTNTKSIGTSTYKWASIYATNFYGGGGNITLGTASRAVVTDSNNKLSTQDLSVTDSNASTNATTTFVQAVTQSATGKITVTKAALNTSGTWSGNAATATTLETGRTLKVSLGSTNASTAFSGSADITDIGVSGTLSIANGGTGKSNDAAINTVFAGPSSGNAGAPSWRKLVEADLPYTYFRDRGAIAANKDLNDYTTNGTYFNATGNNNNTNTGFKHTYGYIIALGKYSNSYQGIQIEINTTGKEIWYRTNWYVNNEGSKWYDKYRILTSANTVTAAQGGTGQSSYTIGDILYASAATTLSKLGGNTTKTRKFLRSVATTAGTAVAPAWDTLTADDIPSITKSKISDFSHTHGNITNDGKMSGSTVSGAVTTSHKFLREDGTWVIPKYTTNTNTTYTIATGDSNGQIKVTPSDGNAYNVNVKGLGSAAYTPSTDYSYKHLSDYDFTMTQPLSKYVTFDKNKPVGAPEEVWYNGFISSHSNYHASYIINSHSDSKKWYVGHNIWREADNPHAAAPTWYLLAHSGNVTTGDSNGQVKIAGVNVDVKGLGSAAYTASTSYAPAAGSSSITTVGTITSGTWNGTTIAIANGGTGKTTAAEAWTALGGGASGKHADSYFIKAITSVANRLVKFSDTASTVVSSGITVDSSNNMSIPGSIYFGVSGANKALFSYSSTYPKYGIWYSDESSDIMAFSASGNGDSKTNADFAIKGGGTLYNRGNIIPHAGTTGSIGGTTTPVYVEGGIIKAGTALKNLAYIDKPSSNQTTTYLRGDGNWVSLSDMGLSNALHFIGITSTELSDGSTTSTLTAKSTNSLSKTTGFVDGDVVMDGDQLREYVWSGSAWRLLGITTSQAYTYPASTSNNTWIAQISQGTDGKITATTGSLVTTGTWSGNAETATAFSSGTTVKLTGDTTGESSSSTKGWSVATTTSALTIKGGRISTPTTAHAQADYSKLYLLISSSTMGDNRPKFSAANSTPAVADGYILDFHWDNSGDYRQQLALLNTTTPGLSIRGKNSSTWSDWYPVITTANIGTGGTNGTIKLGGTEVAVKGLGSAAYTESTAYAAASHGTHVSYGTSTAKIGTASAGSATTVSRSDHVHAIDLATGDNNGQVKIAGTNVSVKGLGDRAFDSTTYLPLAGGVMTGNIRRYYSAASTEPLITVTSNDKDILLWEIGHGTAAATTSTSNHYKLLYKGTNSTPDNYLQLIAHNGSNNTDTIAIQINENGYVSLKKDLYYIGTKAATPVIQFLDNTVDANGNGIKIGSGGVVVVGSGESMTNFAPSSAGSEILYLLSDNQIYIESNGQSIANRVGFQVTNSNEIIPVKAETNTNNYGSIGTSSYKWANMYATTFNGELKGNADTATTLKTGRTLKVSLGSTNASTAFNGSADITDIGVNGTLAIANGGTGATTLLEAGLSYVWTAKVQGQTWSRLCYVPCSKSTVGSSILLNIRATRDSVVYNYTLLINPHHQSKCHINVLQGSDYSEVKFRGVVDSTGNVYLELNDSARSIATTTQQSVTCTMWIITKGTTEPTLYETFTTGATLPSNFTAREITLAAKGGFQTSGQFTGSGAGLTSIPAGQLTGTVPASCYTNTTYTNGTGLSLDGTTFNHSNSVTAKTSYGSTAATASANGGTIIVTDIKYDAQGHITASTDRTITLSQTTYNFSGTSFTSGKSDTGEHDANKIKSNGVWSITSNGPASVTGLGAQSGDMSLYTQFWSTSWGTQIAADYRDGQLFVRALKNGDWQSWYAIPKFTTSTGGVGGTTTPVYIDTNGDIQACNTYAGGTAVTVNGTSKASSTASFYAPTEAGTNGQYLKSSGSGAPTWATLTKADISDFSHTHSLSIATDTGTNALTFAANTKYKLTAGGSTYIFTTQNDAGKLNQTSLGATAALSSFINTSALIYTAKGGGNTVTDKPTDVDAFGIISFKTADGWYGQLLMSSNTSSGIYWRTATSLSGDWKTILDSNNTTAPTSVPVLSWGAESTVFTLNGTAVKIKAMAKPSAADIGAAPSSTVSCTAANVKSALGISSSGSATKWLNQKGSWTTPTAANIGAASNSHKHGELTNDGKLANASRLAWTKTGSELHSGSHYASSSKVAINYTDEPTTTFHVQGSSKFVGNMAITRSTEANLIVEFTSTHENINRNISMRIGNPSRYFGFYDHDHTQWIFQNQPDGTNVFNGNASSATALANLYDSRPTNANITHIENGGVQYFISKDGTTTNGPGTGNVLHFHWDTAQAWDSQLYIPDTNTGSLKWRGSSAAGTWGNWTTVLDSANYSSYALPLSGGQMTGPLTWANATALPQKTSADYFLAIDAFADGGKTYFVSKANVLSSIGAAASSHNHGNIGNGGVLDNKNRLVWTDGDKKIYAGYHYASATQVAINSTNTPTTGVALSVNGNTSITGDLIFPTVNKLDWNGDTYRQRITITDDGTSGTAVFTFQQSADAGTNYLDLFTIKDTGSAWAGAYAKNTAQTDEHDLGVQGGAGKIFLYAAGATNGNKGLYAWNAAETTKSIILAINQSNQITTLAEITGTLTLSKTQAASGTANNSPALIVGGAASSTHLELDCNDIMAKASGTTTAALYLNAGGNAVILGKASNGTTDYVEVRATTAASSTATGALRVGGGVGIGGALYVGSSINTANQLKFTNTSGMKHIEFTRTESNGGPSYISYPTSGYLAIGTGSTYNDSIAVFDRTNGLRPGATDTYYLGSSDREWSATYSKKFIVEQKVTMQWNSTDQSLDFIFA